MQVHGDRIQLLFPPRETAGSGIDSLAGPMGERNEDPCQQTCQPAPALRSGGDSTGANGWLLWLAANHNSNMELELEPQLRG